MNRRLMLALKLLFNLTSQILYASVASVLCTITSPCAIEQFEVESTAASLNFDDMEKESGTYLQFLYSISGSGRAELEHHQLQLRYSYVDLANFRL